MSTEGAGRPVEARIVLVDDHAVVREGLIRLLSHEPGLTVCGEADTYARALEVIASTKPDLVVVDLALPDRSGLELIKDIQVRFPGLPVLALSMHDAAHYAERVLRAGGRGFITKDEPGQRIREAIRTVLAGEIWLSEAAARRILRKMTRSGQEKETSPDACLSDRELQVFIMVGQGFGTGEIARRLNLSPKTIDTYYVNMKQKIGLQDTAELRRYAIQWARDDHAD